MDKRHSLKGKGYYLPFLFFILFFYGGEKAEAAVKVLELYDPFNLVVKSPYYKDYGSYDSYQIDISGKRAASVTFTSYDDDFINIGHTKTYTREQYGWTHFDGMGFNCNVPYVGELHDASGVLLVRAKLVVSGLKKPSCDSQSGGSGEDIGSGECDACGIFDCPGWHEHLGKLDDIKNAIPPAPNWGEVSKEFSDAIVPNLIGGTKDMLDDLLGRAPEPPAPPPDMPTMPDLPDLDDGGFKDKEPEMQDSGVEGFDKDAIKDQAPEIKYEEDDTGGFDLSVDPVENLPNVVPGGDPGEYKRDPVMMPADYPGKPNEGGDIGKPPIPNDGGGKPPIPNDGGGKPPIPGDGGGKPPIPDDGGGKPPGYMPKPK